MMKQLTMIRRLLAPSLGKIGLTGIGLCLALGMYAPPAPEVAPAVAAQAPSQSQDQVVSSAATRDQSLVRVARR